MNAEQRERERAVPPYPPGQQGYPTTLAPAQSCAVLTNTHRTALVRLDGHRCCRRLEVPTSRGRRRSSSLVVGRLGYQDTAVIVSPPRQRHAHTGRKITADYRTPTAADHRPQIAAYRWWRRHPTSQAPATAVLSRSCVCATRNSHLRRRIVADVNAAVAAGEIADAGSRTSTRQAGTSNKRRQPGKEGLQRRLSTRRWRGAKPSQGARARYVARRVPAPPPRSTQKRLGLCRKVRCREWKRRR